MISTTELLEQLGYKGSPVFLTAKTFRDSSAHAHIFRLASQDCGLKGVYTLRRDDESHTIIPLVYVCEAKSAEHASEIHRLAWNQNVVPFVLVRTPLDLRIYSGFAYESEDSPRPRTATAVLSESIAAAELVSRVLPSFHADRIDDGSIWQREGRYVTPQSRVDWKLLDNLERLGDVLRGNKMSLEKHAAHALIGKYVYLRYLRDRDILSDERLEKAGVAEKEVFGRRAKIESVKKLIQYLDDWLNGSVFDIPWGAGVKAEHVRQVAGVFFGDDPAGQLNLFEDYDFAHIPVETLSVVYQQFLHAEGKGRKAGAYYTPIPLVDFVLDEMDELRPLRRGMRVLDPACGSGAFLVQAYRRLIERELAQKKRQLRPTELRELLLEHFFGIDRDEDACQVAELSLILTLLDYVNPPDLTNTSFKLPKLRGRNIFGGRDEDYFNPHSQFRQTAGTTRFDWVIGNPPWTELSTASHAVEDRYALDWMTTHAEEHPTGGNQVAEFFAWKVTKDVADDGVVGLLLPAMTLFKDESTEFRKRFFAKCRVESVVNLANLAYVLFAGRSQVPCAAFFYRRRLDPDARTASAESVISYSPFLVNQEANRPTRANKKLDTWSVVVNTSEIRQIPLPEILSGDALTWKLSMWGSYRDRRLLRSLSDRFVSLGDEMTKRGIEAIQGFELRQAGSSEATVFVKELIGKSRLVTNKLRGLDRIFYFPSAALQPIKENEAYLRVRGGTSPIIVCRPPHVIVGASRNFAVYSDDFIAIPPRQIGVAGSQTQSGFLKLLALFLNSDFALYHQLLCAPRWGVHISDSNLATLKSFPVPFDTLSGRDLNEWLNHHDLLVALSSKGSQSRRPDLRQPSLFDDDSSGYFGLMKELNTRVYNLLRLSEAERLLVEDFVHVRRSVNKGKASQEATRFPADDEIRQYAVILIKELDAFFDDEPTFRHAVTIALDSASRSGLIEIRSRQSATSPIPPKIETASGELSANLARARKLVREKHSQWLYFERNLRIYEGRTTFVVKPLQRIQWLRSQALLDADAILAEIVGQGE